MSNEHIVAVVIIWGVLNMVQTGAWGIAIIYALTKHTRHAPPVEK